MATTVQEQFSMELCELLQTLSLTGTKLDRQATDIAYIPKSINAQDDVTMSDDPSYQSDATESDCSSISTKNEPFGCAYLQAIRSQLDTYPTTGGEYLEAIFTHREILSSYPTAHRDCARGFSDIAYLLEKRAWRADRDADIEAVTAFRHEAWHIAATMSHYAPTENTSLPSAKSAVCVMQPAW
ncbi:hypothetical protein F5880DRAFT_737933 [Lentinula raphanica]|nr:hypothetical protein F5880DRAFT_737933 [Lentinula raphanica]